MTILIVIVAFLAGIVWGALSLMMITDYKIRKISKRLNSQYEEFNKSNEKDNGK